MVWCVIKTYKKTLRLQYWMRVLENESLHFRNGLNKQTKKKIRLQLQRGTSKKKSNNTYTISWLNFSREDIKKILLQKSKPFENKEALRTHSYFITVIYQYDNATYINICACVYIYISVRIYIHTHYVIFVNT